MKKHFLMLGALCALLTSCENYTGTSHQAGGPSRGTPPTQTRDQGQGAVNQPGNPNNPEVQRNQGR